MGARTVYAYDVTSKSKWVHYINRVIMLYPFNEYLPAWQRSQPVSEDLRMYSGSPNEQPRSHELRRTSDLLVLPPLSCHSHSNPSSYYIVHFFLSTQTTYTSTDLHSCDLYDSAHLPALKLSVFLRCRCKSSSFRFSIFSSSYVSSFLPFFLWYFNLPLISVIS